MAIRYSLEALIQLRDSPLCIKPSNLPPAEEWMGSPADLIRSAQGNKPTNDRARHNDSALLDQSSRRQGNERNLPRGNTEDIILGPPRTTFSSATLLRGNSDRNFGKDGDPRGDSRFPFRTRNGDGDGNDRFRNNRDRDRDGRNNFRPRGEADQDSDGWTPVKPRKSFGHEGAERFHGRMNDRPDRFSGDRRSRDDEDRDNGERTRRAFGEFSKDKDAENGDRTRKNGLTRNRSDQPWSRENNQASESQNQQARFDRGKSWRERAPAESHSESQHDKPNERSFDRRWDRDHRQEREPEWLDEPLEEKPQSHTGEDLKKFMESMKAGKSSSKGEATSVHAHDEAPAADNSTPKPTPGIQLGQDAFFNNFLHTQPSNDAATSRSGEASKEGLVTGPKPKAASRFQNFFSAQEESRRQAESPGASVLAAPPPQPPHIKEVNPLLALAGAMPPGNGIQSDASEKAAFQSLISKLQRQTAQTSTPPGGNFSEPPPSGHDYGSKSPMTSPGAFSPLGQERREDPTARTLPLQHQGIHALRPQHAPQAPPMRPEQQALHDLVGQRQPLPHQTAQPGRTEPLPNRNSNSNTEFLMALMQGSRGPPQPQAQEPPVMRMPQPSRPTQIPPTPDREPDFTRERSTSQLQGRRPPGLPSFFDDPPHQREQDTRQQQPTQILQRQGLPGLDMAPSSWMPAGGQPMPPPGRSMGPPPGLAGNQRSGPLPGMFPPNFPVFPPPEAMGGPPRNMAPPPGFFGGPPPPGFMPPPGMGGFQGPESVGFGFDARGMPPPGAGAPFRRG